MKKLVKIIITLGVIGVVLIGVWFSLDKTTRCKLIYGKNICNFYAMMDTVSHNPETSDFEKAMQLCQEMSDVPKKDGCFEYIAQVVFFYDVEKAKEACDEIKGFDGGYGKEDCYKIIQKPDEKEFARQIIEKFIIARIQRNQPFAESFLTDNAKGQYLVRSDLPLVGLSNPHFASYEVLETEKLDSTQFKFKVRIYEEYTSEGIIDYFDETLIVVKKDDKYMVDSLIERSKVIEL